MNICVIGATGKIGRLLLPKLTSEGYNATAFARSADKLKADTGLSLLKADLEDDFTDKLAGFDAVVFTAGSGATTGADKTILVDLWGALKSYKACKANGIKRYIMVSARRAAYPESGPEKMRPYLIAKNLADEALKETELKYTILRPGTLTDEPATGHIKAAEDIHEHGNITREDTANAIIHCIKNDKTIGKTIALIEGNTPLLEAIESV